MAKRKGHERVRKASENILHPIDARKRRRYKREERRANGLVDEIQYETRSIIERIERCEAEIAEGTCVAGNRMKLRSLEKAQTVQYQARRNNPTLKIETILHLDTLDIIEDTLIQNQDPCDKLPNVQAIKAAYQNGTLNIVDGQVSFWANGRRLRNPSPFSWADFRRLNTAANRNGTGFWVEGGEEEPLMLNRLHVTEPTNHTCDAYHDMVIRLRSATNTHTIANNPDVMLRFLDDTGSSAMRIYMDDMLCLTGTADSTE